MPYFECLHCGNIAPVKATPPKCPGCGHGNGIIHKNEPLSTASEPERQRTSKPGEPGGGWIIVAR